MRRNYEIQVGYDAEGYWMTLCITTDVSIWTSPRVRLQATDEVAASIEADQKVSNLIRAGNLEH